MTIAAVQKNAAATAAANSATMPAWGSTTTAGNLLLVIAMSTSCPAANTWTATPTGYTAVTTSPQSYDSAAPREAYAIFWKIAAGGDATPSVCSVSSGTPAWVVYTYEFAASFGWLVSPIDTQSASATSNTPGTTKNSGATAALAQTGELGFAVQAATAAVTALSFNNGYTVDNPASPNGKLWVGWQELAVTTAQNSTASWTGSQISGCRVAMFKPSLTAPATGRSKIIIPRRSWAGA